MHEAIWLHIVTVLPILLFKITLMIVGYLIARLGYKLLVEGITGNFKVIFKYKSFETNLVSGLPGLFFVFLAVLLMGYAVFVDKPFGTKVTKEFKNSAYNISSGEKDISKIDKPLISDKLEEEGGE